VILLLPAIAWGDPPIGYYNSVDTSSPAALRATLNAVIDDHVKFPYSSSSTDTWDILEQADEDPNNSANILDVYRNRSIAKFGGGTGPYNREHTWPNSYGFPTNSDTNYPYTDCHHLFLCDVGYNGDRANHPFGDVTAGATERITDINDGQGGGSGVFPGNSNWFTGNRWQTWIGRKGDVARAMFYMDVRYEGGNHGGSGAAEPDLILTDDTGLIVTTGGTASVAYMGLLAILRQWHIDDPVDQRERDRNDVVFSYQGNRNPFIDHPEWVETLYGEATDVFVVPAIAQINDVYPNPMNPASNVVFTLASPGTARIDVFAIDGRWVRTLLDAPFPAGTFHVRWDGADRHGATAASGAYVVRLHSGSGVDTRKVLLLK
jgi:endonuclease I